AMLAKLLLMSPDLLLLDEPTNHLDLPTIEWLENYLKDYQGTYVIVSHDRFFLDKTVNRIAEVAHQQLFHFKGNFSSYLDQKEERDELMQRQFDNQQSFIRQQMQFISRFRYKASKSTAVQSRVKMLERMDKIEIKDKETRAFNIRFNIRQTPGKVVSEIENVSKSYGDLRIMSGASAQLLRGDKVALVGANGKGKSTLLRMIYGSESYEGKVELGWNAEAAFFAQHQLESLNLKHNLLEEIATVSAEYTENELRTVLGCFLFTGEEVFKKVKVLSGGEKSRLALAKTLITQANLLLLDEPTNHLDMFSTSVLAEALENYAGTLLFVSHDRTFVSRVATKIWWIEHGKLKEFPGSFDEYNEWMKTREPIAAPVEPEPMATPSPAVSLSNDSTLSKNQIKKREDDLHEAEKAVARLKEARKKLEWDMASPELSSDAEGLQKKMDEYQILERELKQAQSHLDACFELWMETQD
ncbi:MAG: ABC-F family ATP-binding cassette domain-containing protein, partial [Bacteroidia bacterium]